MAFVAVGIGVAIGTPLGLTAAARGGWVDELVMRGNDLIFAFPALLLAVMITAVMGPGAINAVIAIGVFNIPVFTRAAARRGARAVDPRIRSGRPHGGQVEDTDLAPAHPAQSDEPAGRAVRHPVRRRHRRRGGLSYVGLGAQPPAPSWGRMLAEAQTMIGFAPWLAIMPGLAIFVTVLGLSLTGDGLRDLFDPRVRRER